MMIDSVIFGSVTLKIDGFDVNLLSEELYKQCKVISLYESGDSLFATIPGSQLRKAESLCSQSDCVFEVIKTRGVFFRLKKYFRRFGFLTGALAASALIFYLSNTVMKVEIVGPADDAQKAEIRQILSAEGVRAGTYIPSVNFLKLSAGLVAQSDSVAWASIGNVGSVVYVNVSMATNRLPAENTRIPSNIVSDRDAVIVKADVMTGQLKVLVGDAVCKGQLLVSGLVEYETGPARYFHSRANIVGRYEQRAEFSQKYREITQIRGETVYRRSLKFFELEIPLPSGLLKDGANYEIVTESVPVKLFGLTLPFSIETTAYTELIENEKDYSDAEALKSLYRRLELYEKNLLSGQEIISREVSEVRDGDGVTLSADYVLEGQIGEVSEIYID